METMSKTWKGIKLKFYSGGEICAIAVCYTHLSPLKKNKIIEYIKSMLREHFTSKIYIKEEGIGG